MAQDNPAYINNGTVYLSINDVATIFNKPVEWGGLNKTVYFGKRTDSKQYLGEHLRAYQSGGIREFSMNDGEVFLMSGVEYHRGIVGNGNWDGLAFYNFDGKYSAISGMIGHVDGSGMDNKSINFYADGKLIQSFDLRADEMAKPFSIDISGVLQVKIEFTRPYISGTRYAIADVVIQ